MRSTSFSTQNSSSQGNGCDSSSLFDDDDNNSGDDDDDDYSLYSSPDEEDNVSNTPRKFQSRIADIPLASIESNLARHNVLRAVQQSQLYHQSRSICFDGLSPKPSKPRNIAPYFSPAPSRSAPPSQSYPGSPRRCRPKLSLQVRSSPHIQSNSAPPSRSILGQPSQSDTRSSSRNHPTTPLRTSPSPSFRSVADSPRLSSPRTTSHYSSGDIIQSIQHQQDSLRPLVDLSNIPYTGYNRFSPEAATNPGEEEEQRNQEARLVSYCCSY